MSKHKMSNPKSNHLLESLQYKDLEGLMKPTIHVDEFSSKMGDDDDIIVVSFFVLFCWCSMSPESPFAVHGP